jgi:hypothetical protein
MNIGTKTFPDLMTEAELIEYLRIPELSKSENFQNVIANLKRMKDLARIYICSKALFPLKVIRGWVAKETFVGK